MDKSILVTGASGFIGSFIVEKALEEGYDVWAGVRSGSSRKFLKDARLHFAEFDFSSPAQLVRQLESHKVIHGSWDIIVHCAGVTKCRNKKEFYTVNYDYTRNFVEALQVCKMIPAQFVYISTLGIYGAQHEKDCLPITSDDTPCPVTEYGKSKYLTEQYLHSKSDFPYIFIRPTGVYGPRERDYYLMAKSMKRHVDFAAGFKTQYLTFVYVEDLVDAIFLAIEGNVRRRAYNISDGNTYSSRQFAQLIKSELGNPFVLRFTCPLFLLKIISAIAQRVASLAGKSSTLNDDKYKIMKQRNWRCDISGAQKELGYAPAYDLERGVKATVKWYKDNGWL